MSSPTIYTPLFYKLFNYQRKRPQSTSTTIFDKPLPSNVEVNNVSNFIAYFVCHHRVLLASEDLHHSPNFLQKMVIYEISDEEVVVVKILHNENWEIGIVNTTIKCQNFIDIIAATFRLKYSSCDCVNK